MAWKKNAYALHRWLGLIVSLQLLAWSAGGLVFSVLHIDNVHGDHERSFAPPPPLRMENVRLTPAEASARAAEAGLAPEQTARLLLYERRGRTVYEFGDAKNLPRGAVDAETGEVVLHISEEEAKAAALEDFIPGHAVRSVEFLEGEPPLEFRERPMPVWRVTMEHPKNPHIYVSPVTGEILARRNTPWRIFDFFWMLHIMDYRGRENFNHPLLVAVASLAFLSAASGLLLWAPRWRRSVSTGKNA